MGNPFAFFQILLVLRIMRYTCMFLAHRSSMMSTRNFNWYIERDVVRWCTDQGHPSSNIMASFHKHHRSPDLPPRNQHFRCRFVHLIFVSLVHQRGRGMTALRDGAVFIAAGVFQWVEFRATPQSVKDANGCGPNGCMTYYQTLYLMMVTVSCHRMHFVPLLA